MILIACILALSFGANTASAITLTFDQASGYVGYVLPAGNSNSSPEAEAAYITYLIGMGLDSTEAGVLIDIPGGGDPTVDLYRTEWAYSFVTPVMWVDKLNDPADGKYSAGSNVFNYVLAKYGNAPGSLNQASIVWFSPTGFTGDIFVPTQGLSHISVFNSFKKDVPDGGATLMLLGGALVGLGALRRKFRV
jgi:hypothetical protein